MNRIASPLAGALALATTLLAAAPATAQLPPGQTLVPAGFQLLDQRDLGGTQSIEAKKANDGYAKGWTDDGIQLQVMWSMNPAAAQIVPMMIQQPADPDVDEGSRKEVSCGHEAHEGGILDCRKVTRLFQEMGEGEDLVTYHVRWMGASATGLVTVEVTNLFGAPTAANGWIDAMIPKLKGGS